jgi:glycosyltransferase involved in cell wall biosynthesis
LRAEKGAILTLHLAFVTPESPYGDELGCGVAAYLRAIVPAIADAGHDVTVVANAKENRTFSAHNGRVSVRHFRLPSLHWQSAKLPLVRGFAPLPLRQFEWSRAFAREAARIAASKKIDVIESTEAGSLFLDRVAPMVMRLHGSQQIFSEHSGRRVNTSVRLNDWLEARACKRATAITVPSKFHAQQISNHRGWPTERVRVIPNPISAIMLKASAEFHRNGSNARVVLYTGRLATVKGIETLIEAAKLVRTADPSVMFVLAGPWQMPKPPAAYDINLNKESSIGIKWVGPKTQEELTQLYQRAALFVMPSYYESFSISVSEAMAFELAVVASNAGALPELISSETTGLLVPTMNPEELAKALLRLLSNNELRTRIASAGRDALLKQFSLDAIVAKTLDVYECAVSKNQCVS